MRANKNQALSVCKREGPQKPKGTDKMKAETKLERAQRIGRERAYYNRHNGGVIVTADQGRSDGRGVHWRALVDGGNVWNGRADWVAGRACGGGYDVRAAAMAEAVRGITGIPGGMPGIDWHNPREWAEIAGKNGWTLYYYDPVAVVLIPGAEVCERIAAEIDARRAANA